MNPLELLPPALRALSDSDREPVLPYEEALAAVEIFEHCRWAVRGWRSAGEDCGGGDTERAAGEPWTDYVHRCAERARYGIYSDCDGARRRRFRLLLIAPD
jgi:hypothetical protein